MGVNTAVNKDCKNMNCVSLSLIAIVILTFL